MATGRELLGESKLELSQTKSPTIHSMLDEPRRTWMEDLEHSVFDLTDSASPQQDKGALQQSRSQTEFQMERKSKCHPGMTMIWFSH